MEEATLTSKSQLTLPRRVREVLGVGPGDRIQFLPTRNGFRLVVSKGGLAGLRGRFAGRRKEPLSIAQMNEDIGAMAMRHGRPK